MHGLLIFFIIFECRLRKSFSDVDKEEEKETYEINNQRIIYIFNNPRRTGRNINQFLILILMIFLDYIYDSGLMYYQINNEQNSELVFGEINKFFDVFFLFLIFRIFHKILFYKHQYLALLIIIIIGFVKFFSNILYDEESRQIIINNFDFSIIILILFFPIIDSIKIYFLQKYMVYNYYSPYFISFLIGIIYLFISTIVMLIFNNIDCEHEICKNLSNKEIKVPNVAQIFLFLFYSIFYGSEHFMELLTINNFTAFHSILIVIFGEFINSIFSLYPEFEPFDLFINIFAYIFEIIGVLVFIETIELNFCGLNRNLTKNIMFRAGNEIESIYNIENQNLNEDDESDYDINDDLNLSDDETVY